MKSLKIITIIGARPQFIKAAAFSRAIARYNETNPKRAISEAYIHTGQHYDYEMNGIFFRGLRLKKPAYNLGVGSGFHGAQTGEILKRAEPVLMKEKPDIVLVYGDTNSTLAGALAAAKLKIPVAHIEAGLRSYNREMPEEINRLLVDHISSWLFCSSSKGIENLAKEGINRGVYLAGDIMYDVLLGNLPILEKNQESVLGKYDLIAKKFILATCHRAENTDNPERLRSIFTAFQQLAQKGIFVAIPLHPRTQKILKLNNIKSNKLKILPPVSHEEMLILEKNAKVVVTDSGGMQKEAYWFSVPCVTIREETEWGETIEAGWNNLVKCIPRQIISAILKAKPGNNHPFVYGDGRAADKIVNYLVKIKLK